MARSRPEVGLKEPPVHRGEGMRGEGSVEGLRHEGITKGRGRLRRPRPDLEKQGVSLPSGDEEMEQS